MFLFSITFEIETTLCGEKMSLADKVILITGASSGIGACAAVELAKENVKLALVGRSAEKFVKVIEKIKDTGTELEPLIILADVSIEAERIISETIEKYEKIDVLINNAGFCIGGALGSINLEDLDQMMATNLRGSIDLTQRALPFLTETRGNVVNVSSVGGIRAIPKIIGYCMTKAAMDHFTRGAALDFASRGIRVNSVNPGYIDNEFHATAGACGNYEFIHDKCAELHPLGRIGTNNEVYNAIRLLIDNEKAAFITGAFLSVDGGLNIKTG